MHVSLPIINGMSGVLEGKLVISQLKLHGLRQKEDNLKVRVNFSS